MKSLSIICSILVITIIPFNCFSITDSTLVKSVMLEKQIMNAANESNRISLLLQKALMFKKISRYSDAIMTLDRINMDSVSEVSENQIHYEKAYNLYFQKSYARGIQEIWNMTEFTSREQVILYLMLLIENEKWSDFKQELVKINPNIDTIVLSTQIKTPLYQDPEHYRKLSRVPGLGLIKAGYTRKGITSILLQTATLGFGIFQYTQGFYATGTFLGVLPARRFYNGGKSLAEASVIKNNIKEIEETKRKCYSYVASL